MQENGVDEPGDQSKDLFGVPPGGGRPDGAGVDEAYDETGSPKGEPQYQTEVIDLIQALQGRQAGVKVPEILLLDLPFLEEVHNAGPECQGKQGTCQEDRSHMNNEPPALENPTLRDNVGWQE